MSISQKIIVLEDSNLLRLRLENVLKKHGYTEVISFTSAEPILKNPSYHLKDVKLILTDINLGEISGIQLAQSLQQESQYRDVPIVFTTGRADKDTVQKALAAGGSDFLVKPFRDEDLFDRIAKIIGEPEKFKEEEALERNADKTPSEEAAETTEEATETTEEAAETTEEAAKTTEVSDEEVTAELEEVKTGEDKEKENI